MKAGRNFITFSYNFKKHHVANVVFDMHYVLT